jgi:hypothetical protein
MKIGSVVALASLGLVGALSASGIAVAEEDFASTVKIEAKREGGKLAINIQPKDGWYVNTEFKLKCTLKAAEGGKLEKAELTKDDAKFVDAGKPGKAKSASFSVGAEGKVEGECKLVTCSDNACSSPFKTSFKSN